jgi:hypothetical protein
MPDSKYKISRGLANIVITGEPVFVEEIKNGIAYVTRVISVTPGMEYGPGQFPVDQLETIFKRGKREIELNEFMRDLQEKAQNDRYKLDIQSQKDLLNVSSKLAN